MHMKKNEQAPPPAQQAAIKRIVEHLGEPVGLQLRGRGLPRVEQGISERRRALGLTTPAPYLPRPADDPELDALVHYAVVGATSFSRDPGQIRLIRHLLLPQRIDARRDEGRLRLWSAGRATGQEAWTLAMLLLDALPDHRHWDLQVLGTDIDDTASALAREGTYGGWAARGLSEDLRSRYFVAAGSAWRNGARPRPLVRFERDNLASGAPAPAPSADLATCRNVLINFRREVVPALVDRIGAAMRPDGWLVTDHGALLDVAIDGFPISRFPEGMAYRRGETKRGVPTTHPPGPSRTVSPRAGQVRPPALAAANRAPSARPALIPPSLAPVVVPVPPPAPARSPGPPLSEVLEPAERRAASGDYAGAGSLARQAMAAAPWPPRSVYLLAQLADLSGDPTEALRQPAHVLYLAPDCIPGFLDAVAHLERLDDDASVLAPYDGVTVGMLKAYLDGRPAAPPRPDDPTTPDLPAKSSHPRYEIAP